MDFGIPRDENERVLDMIEGDASPVGIDAKETRIVIVHKPIGIERRPSRTERQAGL